MHNSAVAAAPISVGRSTQTMSVTATPALDANAQFAKLELERAVKNGANWFYWIAALTVINSVMALTGSEWGFALGLSITQAIDYVARDLGAPGMIAAVVIDLFAVATLVLLGVFANKRHKWAFIVGLICYALDTALTLFATIWIGIIIHVWAIWAISIGLSNMKKLRNLEQHGIVPAQV